ncbi:hypothetical protein CTA2_4208 [Colletotrichum tanaceti]|uniref:Uncharacterized protein n=1 Tax=Colletotrichum tanaceti TaxID=1306861 RepID=A0A4U6X821_9PEZI|nr:hypothetical protein CTA2_4208 [Colletotrichum tanaceti]TKW51668.1 hypothetical protein CTA1_12598 [Colletotrichum tanaceti]
MRRHESTRSRSTLTRSKSTTSVRSAIQRLEHIDPVTAERDAHIAATLSFARSGLDPGTGMGASTSRHHTRSATMDARPAAIVSHDRPRSEMGSQGYHENGLRRQNSVRFVIRESRSKRPQIQLSNDDSSETGTIRRRSVFKNVGNRPLGQAPDKVERPFVSTYTTSYIDSLPPVESFGSPDECGPPPASYRRLRKSQSMLAPSNPNSTANYASKDCSEQPSPQPSLRRKSMQNMKGNSPSSKTLGLRAPKSTSFLKVRGPGNGASIGTREQNDLVVQEAEDNFRRDVENQQYLRPRSSIFFSKTKKSQSPLVLRKSMRDKSYDAHFDGSANILTVSKDASLRRKARKVSSSLKTKLKEIFRRSKKEDSMTPANEAEPAVATEDQGGVETEQDDPYMDIIDPVLTDECSISQVPSRVPSLHNASSAQRLRSRQGSIESIGSERKVSDEKSRVTSWTSSGTHTLNSQSTWGGERDRQRLSIIKENGPHQSSSSFRRPSRGDRNPYEFKSSSPPPPSEPVYSGPSVDSARVYSALMTRLNEAKQRQQEKESRERNSGDWGSERLGSVRLPKSDDEEDIGEGGQHKPPTIRYVLHDDDVFRDSQWEQQPPQEADVAEVVNLAEDDAASASGSVVHHRQRFESETTLTSDIPIAPKTLSTRRSAFFGSPTCHLFRTTSPYRKALQASIKESTSGPAEVRSPTASSLNLDMIPMKRHPSFSKEDPRLAYSESIYSDELLTPTSIPQLASTPSRLAVPHRHPSHRATHVDLRNTSSASGLSDAVVTHSPDRAPLMLSQNDDTASTLWAPSGAGEFTSMMQTDRTVSNASSVEWKTWLSANASKTDANLVNARTHNMRETQHSRKDAHGTLGHVREGAEIEESQSPVSCKPTDVEKIRLQTPLRAMSHNSRQASSTSRIELGVKTHILTTPSRDENAAPLSDMRISKHMRGIYGPPPIPPRSSLRSTPSMPLMQPRTSQSNIPLKSVESSNTKMRSLGTRSRLQSANAPPTPSSRSPIKAARYNGLHSGLQSSTSSPGLTMAVEKQFGPMLAGEEPSRGSPRERGYSMRRRLLNSSDSEMAVRSDAVSLDEWNPQAGGGKQMLEDFLSSRRQVSVARNDSIAFL